MNREADQQLLQDYLDGRLPQAERVAFEARLARETELLRQLESYREIARKHILGGARFVLSGSDHTYMVAGAKARADALRGAEQG